MSKPLPRKFYNRPTLEVAKDLLGCILLRKINGKEIRAVITDVEAYIGEDDLACHASKGRTLRTEIMYGKPGFVYVYLIYGMYNILNIITESKNFPAAVMIRAVKIENVDYKKTNGPGKVCMRLGIDKKLHSTDVTLGQHLWIEKPKERGQFEFISSPRVGIAYAKHCSEYPWRFSIKQV